MLRLLSLLALFIIVPLCLGLVPARGISDTQGKRKTDLFQIWMFGFVEELALFQLISVPIILRFDAGLGMIVRSYSILLAVASGVSLVLGRTILKEYVQNAPSFANTMKHMMQKRSLTETLETAFYVLCAGGLVLYQMVMSYRMASFDGDDAYYVAQAVIADQTDVLYRILPYTGLSTAMDVRHALAPLPIWEAYVARVSGIHAAIVCHTLLPLVLLPATYLAYAMVGRRLFHNDVKKTALFMILVNVLMIFGNTSIYTPATFYLMRTWQGKSLMCNLVMVLLLWVLLNLREKTEKDAANWGIFWFLVCLNIMSAMMSTMGAFLGGLFLAITGLVLAIRERRPLLLVLLGACCLPNLLYLLLYVIAG